MAAGVASEILVQLSYAIGVVEPTSININTYNTSKVSFSDPEIAIRSGKFLTFGPMLENRLKLETLSTLKQPLMVTWEDNLRRSQRFLNRLTVVG